MIATLDRARLPYGGAHLVPQHVMHPLPGAAVPLGTDIATAHRGGREAWEQEASPHSFVQRRRERLHDQPSVVDLQLAPRLLLQRSQHS
jgi:hypothetical protein